MPFGDNGQTYSARVSREAFGPGMQEIPARRVSVPEVDPPTWWSEYLLEEWKRKHRYQRVPRDGRTQWQRSRDEWNRQVRCWELQDFGLLGDKPGLTRPPHSIWGNFAKGRKSEISGPEE